MTTPASTLILPMATHVALAALLYVLLTVARAPRVWGIGGSSTGFAALVDIEARISANLSNQFEWPLFFHVACLVFLARGEIDVIQLWFAWIFVAGRLAHSLVQILTSNIRLRGLVFTINFVAVLALWASVLMIESAQQ